MVYNKKLLIGIVAIFLIIMVVVIVVNPNKNDNNGGNTTNDIDAYERYIQELQDGSKINISQELLKAKTFNGLDITNISLKYKNGITTLVADITNKSIITSEEQKISVIFQDNKGNEVERLNGVIDKVESGQTVKLSITITKDIVNVYSFKVVGR